MVYENRKSKIVFYIVLAFIIIGSFLILSKPFETVEQTYYPFFSKAAIYLLGIGGNLIAPFLFVPAAILGFSLIIIPFVLAVVKNEFVKKELEYIFLLPIVGSSFGLGILLYHIFANFVVVTCGNYEFTSIGYFAFAFFGTILLFNSIFLNKKVRVKFFSEI